METLKKKNILFISSWYPNKLELTNGNFVQRHAEAVSMLHHVEVLHSIGDFNQREKFIFDDKIINGIRTLIVYYKNTKNPVLNFIRRMKAYSLGFKKMNKPDLVHANVHHNSMMFAVYLKKRFKIPFVITEHWTALRKINENKTSKGIKMTARTIGNHASKILPVSKDLASGLRNLGMRTSMKVIPNVVDTSLFSPKKTENKEFTFIHVSNLIPRKNPEKILNVALKLLEKGYVFRLQIGGDGDISKIKDIAKKSDYQDKIEIFGIQTLPEIADRMRRSDCFILFSDDENQPCVIAEAFASGIKVISTNVGGISEFFPENAGILLDSVDENLLEAAMIHLLENKDSDSEFLVNYANSVFSEKTIAEEYSKIYSEVLEK
ncbi:MAG: glycosyltransferase [Bergeyella sp.]